MIKLSKHKRIFIIASALAISCGTAIYAADPGSADDPLITLSYFTEKFEEFKKDFKDEFKEEIKEELLEEEEETTEPDLSVAMFKLINLKEGSTLICSEGAEFIIRTGKMEAIASATGGLSDVTTGTNIDNGVLVPYNQHIIIPRHDGRGLNVTTGGALMIKGNYTVIEPQ